MPNTVYTIGFVSLIYFSIAIQTLREGDWPHAGMWASYGCANLFLLAYEIQKKH
jgi:hypothetical protein